VGEEALDSLNMDLHNFLESLVRLADHLGKKRSKPDKKVKGRRSSTSSSKKEFAKSKELAKENSDDEEEDTSEKVCSLVSIWNTITAPIYRISLLSS
jgi:hypothetical protein